MSDLIFYIPNHGYLNNDLIFVSWLNQNLYVRDRDVHSFRLAAEADSDAYIQFTETLTGGFVRELDVSETGTIDGLDHLEGETVTLVSGGEVLGQFVVESGQIQAPFDIGTYSVGLPYTMRIRTTRFAIPQEQTVQTKIKNINETIVRHIRTKGGFAGQEANRRVFLEPMNAEFSRRSDDSRTLTQGGYDKDGFTVLRSSEGLPMTAIATIVALEVVGA